jgi:hypothetical protein
MYETDNGVGHPAGPAYRLPQDGKLPDLPLYERLIAEAHLREVERFGQHLPEGFLRPPQPPSHRRPRDPNRRRG